MNPPAFATWLLERFEVRDATIGDLIERYRSRPSRAWYWRQVCLAILAEAADEIREHWLLAVRVVASGFVVLVLLDRAVISLLEGLSFHGAMWVGGRLVQAGQLQSLVRPAWIASLPVGGLLAGSIVGRFHRPSMIGLFAGSFVGWQFVQFWLFVVVQSVWIPLGDYLVFSMLLLVSVLIGGLWTVRRSNTRHRFANVDFYPGTP